MRHGEKHVQFLSACAIDQGMGMWKRGFKACQTPSVHVWLVALTLLVAAGLNVLLGQVGFNGYDASSLVDVAWRLNIGQHPYRDFYCTLPPAYYLTSELFFKLLGVHWYSLTIAGSVTFLAFAVLSWSAIICSKAALSQPSRNWLTWISIAALYIPLVETNHLWHSTMAAEAAVYLLLVSFLIFRQIESAHRVPRTLVIQLVLASAICWLSKPNTGWMAVGATTLVCIVRPRVFAYFCCAHLLGGMLAAAFLASNGISPIDVINSYLTISDRPKWIFLIGFEIAGYAAVDPVIARSTETAYASLAMLLGASLPYLKNVRQRLRSSTTWLPVAAVAISIAGFLTNWDLKLNDIGPAVFGLGIVTLPELTRIGMDRWRWLMRAAVAITCSVALYNGATHLRAENSGPWGGPRYGPPSFVADPFFGQMFLREQLASILYSVDGTMAATRHDRVFFGPRMEFMYARLGVSSPRDLPVWWHAGTSFPAAAFNDVVAAWKSARFDLLIFARGEYTRMPILILQDIVAHYRLVPVNDALDVYIRKD